LQSAKQSQHGSFSSEIYKSFNPTPPPRPSNSKHSHFGLGNPIYKKFQVTTQHKTTFQDHPADYQRALIDPDVKDRLSLANWGIGTPSTGPVVNSIAKLSFQDRDNPYQGTSKKESIKNIGVMREHHYKFGENALNYETSSKRIEHNNRTIEQDRQPVRSVADAKKELDGHHFDFGNESPNKITTHQQVFEKKVTKIYFTK
jgi:hypothetical protein